MDLGSANESLEETRDVHKEDGLGFVGKRSGELDLNLVASKEEGDEDFGHEKEACVMRRIDVDLNQEEPQKFPESSVEIGINLSPGSSESPLPKSRSPSPGPVNSLSTVNDKSDRGDIYQGKSPMLITERQTSDYNSWRSLSPSRDGSSPHRMGRESLDYNSDGSRSPLDIKTSRGEMGAVICDSCAGRSPSPGQIASSDYETEKGNSAPNFGKPSVAVTTDCSPEEMERENSDLCERKSVAIHDETTKEIVDNPKSLFESVHEKMEVGPNHYSEEFHYPDESKYRCVENFDQHSGKLPSPVRTVYSDDEPKEEIFYTEKSSSPENSKPYNGEAEAGDSYIHSPGRTPKRSASPVRRQMSVSPYRSPYEPPSSAQKPPPSIKNIQEPSNSEARGSQPPVSDPSRSPVTKNKSPRRKRLRLRSRSPSPKRVRPQENLRPDASPYSRRRVSPVKHPSPSPGRAPARDVQRRNDSPRNHLSASPRRRNSPPGSQRRRDRSVSRSPVRRDAYSGSRRDYHERSRSRSPYSRDRYRSSSRRRCSPRRRRSPAFGYCSRYRSPRRRPWSPPPNRSTGIGKPGNNLFVAGFSFVTTERDLEKKFSRFGRVTDVGIVRDKRSGDSRGFGFLSLERDEDADAAIRALDQTEWNGRVVLVEKSKAPAH